MLNIAIDGPSGAGKSTVARELAKRLNILYLDTGAMYRAAALYCLSKGRAIEDKEGLEDFLQGLNISVEFRGIQHTFLNGVDVSTDIRQHHISKAASDFSAHREVRLKLVALQREIAKSCNLVLDGRDIGTFVLENAKHKFYLTASVDERAKRRALELSAKGEHFEIDRIKRDIIERDYNDMHRDFAPLKQAVDAMVIDSSSLTVDEVVEIILNEVRSKS